LVWELNG